MGRNHLAQRCHHPIRANGDHVVLVAHGLARILKNACATWLWPDGFRFTKSLAYIGFRGKPLFQGIDALLITGHQPQQSCGYGSTCRSNSVKKLHE